MSRPSFYLPTLFVLLCLPLLACGQETVPPDSERAQKNAEQATELLNTLAESIPALRNAENRIHLSSVVADLLWTKDESRARTLIDSLTNDVAQEIAGLDPADQKIHSTLGAIQQQRREALDRIARRDPELALAFLSATRLPSDFDSTATSYHANESQLELHLAGLLAQAKPEHALRTARASLRKGLSHALISLLAQIAGKDQATAQALHKEIVDRLKTDNLTTQQESTQAAWNLLNSFQPPQASEDTYRELVEILVAAALSKAAPTASGSNSFVQNFQGQFPSLISQVEKYAPARLAAMRQLFQNIQRTLDPATRMYQELNEVAQRGTVDDLLAMGSKQSQAHRTQIYQRAAWKALSAGDIDRARQIISEFIPDPMQRRQLLDQLESQLIYKLINEGKFAETRRVLNKLSNVEQRVQLLVSLAANVVSKGTRKEALELLAEATTLADSLSANTTKLHMHLQIAQGYAALDPQQSVALMQPVIAQVNQLVAAGAVLDGIETSYLKEGEWMRRSHNNLGNLVNNIGLHLGALARQNLEGARALSDQFERPEIRMMAQLEIVQALLSGSNLQITQRRHLIRLSH